MNFRHLALALLLALAAGSADAQSAQGTGFTFQGLLQQGGTPLTGLPDLEFRLFDSTGSPIGPVLTRPDWPVDAGLLVVALDFGAAFNGQARFLQVTVNGTALAPNIPISSTPYALTAQSTVAGSVSSASIVDGTIVAADVNPAAIQRRITTACGSGSNLQAINQDGSGVCQPDAGGNGDVTGVLTPAASGLTGGNASGDVTLAIAAGGITAAMIGTGQVGGSEIADSSIGFADVDTAQLQRRIAVSCGAGGAIRTINQDGTSFCESVGWTFGGNAGTNPATQFIGTSDGAPLRLQAGGVGVNTSAPLAPLHVRSGVSSLANATPDPGTVINAERATGNAFVSVMGTAQRGLLFGEPGSVADGGLFYDNGGSELLDFRTGGNATRMQLGDFDPDGALGLAKDTTLLLRGQGGATTWLMSTDAPGQEGLYIGLSAATYRMSIRPDFTTFTTGVTVLGSLNPFGPTLIQNTLGVTGTASKPGGGSWAVLSDARLKRDVEPLEGALDRLLALRGVTYEYLPGVSKLMPPGRQTGFIAQEAREVFPEWVGTGDDGYLFVEARGFEALTVEALRDLKARNDIELDALRVDNAQLRAELDAIRTRLDALAAAGHR